LLGQDIAVALDARCPTFLLDERGRVRHANRAAEDLMAQDIGLRIISGRLSSARSDVARRLEGLIGSAGSPDGSRRAGGAITLTAPGRRSPLCVAAAPLRSEHLSVFAGRLAVIVWVTDQDPGPSLPQARLRERFGLTSAEGRLALALLDGASPREAAGELGLSYHTVRNQLQGVFEKTGVHRQTELIMLLMRAISPEFA
jgi:DNA-binding CsgD family transcriptional regulator